MVIENICRLHQDLSQITQFIVLKIEIFVDKKYLFLHFDAYLFLRKEIFLLNVLQTIALR